MKRATTMVLVASIMLAVGIVPEAGAADGKPNVPRERFELYVLAGQSNMRGTGGRKAKDPSLFDKVVDPRVYVLNEKNQWEPATDPLVAGAYVGPGLTFGKLMAQAKPDAVIGLIPCAWGGSPIGTWQPGAVHQQPHGAGSVKPWDRTVERTQVAMKDGVLKAILWHQGESDATPRISYAGNSVPDYEPALIDLIGRFRKQFGSPDLPVVVGELGRWDGQLSSKFARINGILDALPAKVKRTACVSSEGLMGEDQYHFDAPSARELGKRYFQAVEKLETDKPQSPGRAQ